MDMKLYTVISNIHNGLSVHYVVSLLAVSDKLQ